MKRTLIPVVLSLLFHTGSQAQAPRLSLEQCIQTALANNIQARQSNLQVEAAEVAHRQSKSNLLPDLNGSITHGKNSGRSIDPFTNSYVNQTVNYASYGLGSGVVLFGGGRLQNSIKQNGYAYDATKMEHQQVKDNLALAVMLAYLLVLSNEDLVQLSQAQVLVTQKQVERLEVLHRQGAVSPPQIYELKGQLKEEELGVVNNRAALGNAKLALAQLMNIPYDSAMTLERIGMEELLYRYPHTADEVYRQATEYLAAVKAAELRTRSAAAGVRSVKGELFPTVVLNGNVNTNYSSAASRDVLLNSTEAPTADYVLLNGNKLPVLTRQNNYASEPIAYGSQLTNNVFTNVGVTLRIPVFNASITRNRVKLASIELRNTELLAENTKVELRKQVDQAYLNMGNAWDRYKVLTDGVAAYTEAFRAAEIRFNAGLGTSIDYLIAKNNLDRASGNLVMARYEYLLRIRVLDFYAGTMKKE
jgi:outer membrane protein